ncbi:MAG: site-specific integrase [Chloroflexi bacterium]|nr:site-specific integrase [Chloroflexota bacterium]
MSDDPQQLSFFDAESDDEEPEDSGPIVLSGHSSLELAVGVYLDHLADDGLSIHTIRAFRSDLNLLGKWGGRSRPVAQFSTTDLNAFLYWLLHERGKPCSPKSYARRVTTLKNFFRWLEDQQAIDRDPAAALIQESVSSPLPNVLLDPDIDRLLRVTERLRQEEEDARPHLLITLLLATGIKKAECMSLTVGDVDRRDPERPAIWVRYDDEKMRYKERRIRVDEEWPTVLEEYISQRETEEIIFDCTARNLEYVLRDTAKLAGVPRSLVSFETLRWSCALRDHVAGMHEERLRQKLGLSRISWRETSRKLQQLAVKHGYADEDDDEVNHSA